MTTNNKETTQVGAKAEEKELPATPEVKTEEKTKEEKTFTQEQVNSIVKATLDKEKAKAEKEASSKEELEVRLETIEAERAKEREEAELKASIAKETAIAVKHEGLISYIETKVLDSHIDKIMKLTLLDENGNETLDELKAKADETISEFPGVEKPTTAPGTTLNKAAAEPNPAKEEEEEKEAGYYTLGGAKLSYTKEEYDKLSYIQKQEIKVVE